MARVLFVAFWVWYAASGVVFLRGPGGFDSIWPLSLSLIWWLVLLFRAELQAWGRAVPLPIWLKFLIVGLFFSDVVMGNLAVSFKGDLHPNLALSSFLWLGAYGGVVLAWWLLAHLYPFTPWQVFFIYGFKGVIIEQDFMLSTMLWKGDWFSALVAAPFLVVVYGSAVAPMFVILQKELPNPGRRVGWMAIGLSIVVTMAGFYAGAFVWFRLVEVLFGLKIPGAG